MSVELPRSGTGTSGSTSTSVEERTGTEVSGPWCAVVWNDPVNLMSYVVFVFERYFGYSRPVAERLMMQVHEEGRAIVSRGSREKVEIDVQAMHSYSLHATLEKAGEG